MPDPLRPGEVDYVEPDLIHLQIAESGPVVEGLSSGTNLVLPPEDIQNRLDHFGEDVYRLTPESHLVRFLSVLLGDAGVGQVRRRLLLSRFAQTIQGSHFYDLDRFYGALFGVRRLSDEIIALDPYNGTGTAEEWEDAHARDASYRARVEQFAQAINLGATPTGMESVAEALLGVDCDIYETYTFVNEEQRTYLDLEVAYASYGEVEAGTYADLQGGVIGRIGEVSNRAEFIIRPRREVTLEEAYSVLRVIQKVKPANSIVTIDHRGVSVHGPARISSVHADSEYWEVKTTTIPRRDVEANPYDQPNFQPQVQPRPVFAAYMGEAWSYNGDIAEVKTYAEETTLVQIGEGNEERVTFPDGSYRDYPASQAMLPIVDSLRGRAAQTVVAAPYAGSRRTA